MLEVKITIREMSSWIAGQSWGVSELEAMSLEMSQVKYK
jgi:hypothetical protein